MSNRNVKLDEVEPKYETQENDQKKEEKEEEKEEEKKETKSRFEELSIREPDVVRVTRYPLVNSPKGS